MTSFQEQVAENTPTGSRTTVPLRFDCLLHLMYHCTRTHGILSEISGAGCSGYELEDMVWPDI